MTPAANLIDITRFNNADTTEAVPVQMSLARFASVVCPLTLPVDRGLAERCGHKQRALDAWWASWSKGEPASGPWCTALTRTYRHAIQAGLPRDEAVRAVEHHYRALRESLPSHVIGVAGRWAPVRWSSASSAPDAVTALVLHLRGPRALDRAASIFAGHVLLAHATSPLEVQGDAVRVILPLAEPIAPADWPYAWEWVHREAGLVPEGDAPPLSRRYLVPSALGPDTAWSPRRRNLDGRLLAIPERDLQSDPRREPMRERLPTLPPVQSPDPTPVRGTRRLVRPGRA